MSARARILTRRPVPLRALRRAARSARCAARLAGLTTLLALAHPAWPQELNPRAYVITPVGFNAGSVGYSHQKGDLTLDGAVPITGATANIDVVAFGYYRSLSLLGHSANVAVGLPYGVGEFAGKVADAPRSAHRSGLLDSFIRLSVNLYGGPAMGPAEFRKWSQDILVGFSLKVVAPTGQYDHTRLINLGTNRWAFKPELGYARRVIRPIVEAYGGIWLFTANDDFLASDPASRGERRLQAPIGALELHVSYDVSPRLWISTDFNYWYGGRVNVDGEKHLLTLQSNSRLGVTASLPINPHQSLKISYSDGLVVRFGGKFKTLSVGWQYAWFGVPFRTSARDDG